MHFILGNSYPTLLIQLQVQFYQTKSAGYKSLFHHPTNQLLSVVNFNCSFHIPINKKPHLYNGYVLEFEAFQVVWSVYKVPTFEKNSKHVLYMLLNLIVNWTLRDNSWGVYKIDKMHKLYSITSFYFHRVILVFLVCRNHDLWEKKI